MNTEPMIEAVEAWVVATIPGISSYTHPPESLLAALPMVLAEVVVDQTQDAEQQLPGMAQYQQTIIRSWAVDMILLVNPDPPAEATNILYGYVDAIGQALRQEVVLDDNVLLAQYYLANYDPPEVRANDGTVARQVTIRVTVGEMIGV